MQKSRTYICKGCSANCELKVNIKEGLSDMINYPMCKCAAMHNEVWREIPTVTFPHVVKI